jgi:probable rRNA maturation factor
LGITQLSAGLTFSYPKFHLLRKWISRVIHDENFTTGEITIVFCTDDYLLSVNKKYLQHDYYTDVITFDNTVNNVIGGDILVSVERVRENAGLYGEEFMKELDRVILHGILHMAGYTDADEKSRENMRMKENYYLEHRH